MGAAMFEGARPLKLVGVKGGTGCTSASAQYKFVKISGENTVVPCAATTDVPVGVLQEPVSQVGDPANVVVVGQTMLQADTSITVGAALATSADGQATTAVATQYVVGQAVNVDGATSAGNIISAVVNCASPILKA